MADKRIGKFAKVFFDDTGNTAREITTVVTAIPELGITFNPIEVGGYTQDMNYLNGRGDSQITLEMLFTTTANTGSHTVFNPYTQAAYRNQAGLLTVQLGNNVAATTGDPEFEGEFIVTGYRVIPDLNGAQRCQVTLQVAEGNTLPAWGTVS